MAEKSPVKEEAEMEGVPDEVVLVNPPLLDFLDELPQAARAVPSTKTVHSAPARFKDDLMLPPRSLMVPTLKTRPPDATRAGS